MTPQDRPANLSLHNGKQRIMGRDCPDPEQDMRIHYNAYMREHEHDATLWHDQARAYAFRWLERESCIAPTYRGEIVAGVQKLTHPLTQDGFIDFMRDIAREWESRKELAKAINTKPARLIPDERPVKRERSTSPFGKPLPVEIVEKSKTEAARIAAHIEEIEMAKLNTAPLVDAANKNLQSALAEAEAIPWTKQPGMLSKFWENVFSTNAVFNKSEAPARALVVEKLGTDPATWPTLDECYAIADAALAGFHQAKIDAQKPAAKTPEKAAETPPAATPIPETPTTPASDEKPSVATPMISAPDNPMAEAAFVVLFSLYGPHGAELKFTVRAMTVEELDARIEALTTKFMSKGYKAERASAPAPAVTVTAAPAPTSTAPTPAPVAVAAPATNGGSFNVSEVKKFVDEGKTEYHLFESGRDKPSLKLRVKGDLDKLAQHIDLSQMEVGRRYALALICEWTNSANVGQNGKPFRNLKALRKAVA